MRRPRGALGRKTKSRSSGTKIVTKIFPDARPALCVTGVSDAKTAVFTKENVMRLLSDLACKTIGHQPVYFQNRITTNGRCSWHKHAHCA